MADTKELANKARATLAQALQALQAAQDDDLMNVAEPIAATMSVLHRIEKGETVDGPTVQQALDNVRGALDTLQKVDTQDDAVDSAMEAVAGSLSKLFTLHRAVSAGPASPPSVPRPPPAAAQAPAVGGTHVMSAAERVQVAAPPPAQAAPPMAPNQAANPLGFAPTMAASPNQHQPMHQQAPIQPPMHAQPMPAQPMQQQPYPAAHAAPVQAATAVDPAFAGQHGAFPADHHVPGMTDAPPPPADSPYVNVELGAHSGSNFYKGLSGNDVIDHGGIFVATYQIPKIGSPVALRILLPGDLEFQADALVQWVRETRSGESQPGFGARFTRITPEGRQLVYRYVRNREPIFYDDF